MCSSRKILIIGMPDACPVHLDNAALAAVGSASAYVGGSRHHALVAPIINHSSPWIEIKAPLDNVFKAMEAIDGTIVVFASGDPLFFGFASTVMRRLPTAKISTLQWLNSLQTLAGRFLLPYQSMTAVSLTGRDWPLFDAALIEGRDMIGVLTDGIHTPDAIARRMIDYGYTNYHLYIGEHLGNSETERLTETTPDVAATMRFDRPNCLIMVKTATRPRPFGIDDADLTGLPGRPAMITKRDIRLATLSALDLRQRRQLWDIGFCTGSVSIEARLQFPALGVVAFERRSECKNIININSRRFGVPGITIAMGDFLNTDLSLFPNPDAVFIGGHGGHLAEIVARVAPLLQPGGVIVFNSVNPSSLDDFNAATTACGLVVDRSTTIKVDDHNPITILRAIK